MVKLHEIGIAAGIAHIVGVVIQAERRSEELRIWSGVDLHLSNSAAGGIVDTFGRGEIGIPVPLFACMLFNKSDCFSDLFGSIFEHVGLFMAERSCKLECGNTVFSLKALCDNAVAHERSVAGGIVLNSTASENAEIILYGNTGLSFGHRAHVSRYAVLLCYIKIMHNIELMENI